MYVSVHGCVCLCKPSDFFECVCMYVHVCSFFVCLCLFVWLRVLVYACDVYSVECSSSRDADSQTKRLSRNVFSTQPVPHPRRPALDSPASLCPQLQETATVVSRLPSPPASPRCCVSCPRVPHSPSLSVSFPRTISTVIEMPASALRAALGGRMCLVICLSPRLTSLRCVSPRYIVSAVIALRQHSSGSVGCSYLASIFGSTRRRNLSPL